MYCGKQLKDSISPLESFVYLHRGWRGWFGTWGYLVLYVDTEPDNEKKERHSDLLKYNRNLGMDLRVA